MLAVSQEEYQCPGPGLDNAEGWIVDNANNDQQCFRISRSIGPRYDELLKSLGYLNTFTDGDTLVFEKLLREKVKHLMHETPSGCLEKASIACRVMVLVVLAGSHTRCVRPDHAAASNWSGFCNKATSARATCNPGTIIPVSCAFQAVHSFSVRDPEACVAHIPAVISSFRYRAGVTG